MVKVITYGTFDLLHYGHIKLLERAKALGDYLIVGVTSDDFDKTRGKINNQQSLIERLSAVKSTGIADEIIVEEYEGQKVDDIRRYDIDIFTVGSDWEGRFDYLNDFCKVVYLPRTKGVSSSDIRAESRKIRMRIIGGLKTGEKVGAETAYVNGVEITDSDNTEDYDAVYIATMPEEHYAEIKKALLDGKHVLCESPVAIKRTDYNELKEIAREKSLILADAIKTAYSTAYSRLLAVAKSGIIGEIVSVDAVCTSLREGVGERGANFDGKQNSMCAWGPTAMLPVFQLLGTEYKSKSIVTKLISKEKLFDGFTKIDFIFENAAASIRIAKAAKAEGELVVTGTKGYIYVPAPWWKTDYFEVRFENQTDNKRFFYQLDGDGIRYEIVAFAKAIEGNKRSCNISEDVTSAICSVTEDFYNGKYLEI
ncbi:MAG: adenylyltransferase/cytidyltransferase family protein [Ruminococcus sp.]|nr:adenylyltransferase/cytidyltransferase family protein [Ruminococcus sp.]